MLGLQQGNTKYAMERAQEAVTKDPKNALAHMILGEVYFKESKYAEAAKEYRAAYDQDPKDAEVAGLGAAYVATGQWTEAEPVLRQVVKANPSDAVSLQNLGIALAAQNKRDEALTFLRQAVVRDPKSARANYALGSVLMDQQQYREALGPLGQAVKLDPKNADYKNTLDVATAHAGAK